MARTVTEEIQRLAALRQEIWDGGGGVPGEVSKIDKQLSMLYEERRIEQAKAAAGGRGRSQIQRRAKLDTEIERLMSG